MPQHGVAHCTPLASGQSILFSPPGIDTPLSSRYKATLIHQVGKPEFFCVEFLAHVMKLLQGVIQ
jgi:hypothetical protein